ncbi:MAG: cupredoxin domain-containing protein [Dehalococcoidia bacterium]|nr:cupredoxin domain-containing protein [Dehalococcoidia bacterium]
MAEEERKRKRGRRRGRQEAPQPAARPQEPPAEPVPQPGELEITAESDVPGVTPPRFRFRRRRKEKDAGKEHVRPAERAASSAGAGGASPMDFWRTAQARTRRERALPRQPGPAGFWRRITSLYFPPWVPVVAIIFVVFAILGLLFFTRSATGAPRIADHWHATYQFLVCGERQPNFPTWEGVGVHTHADGVIHIHPFSPSEEGSGARLVKWFEYGGGTLTGDEVRAPGTRKTYKNGDACDDGRAGVVQVSANGRLLTDWSRYIPHDGDRVRIEFGPPGEITQLADRTIIPDTEAKRTISLEVSGDTEGEAKFTPGSLEVTAGEAVKIDVKNIGKISHGFRVNGDDGAYDTADDFVVKPTAADAADTGDILLPGQDGSVVVRFDVAGTVEFRDPAAAAASSTGSIIVRQAVAVSPTPSAAPQEVVDVTLDVTFGDASIDPPELTVDVGQKFRINLNNPSGFIHNLRIAGPDGQFKTDDDIVPTEDVLPGQNGELVGQIASPGVYEFRDDFHPTEINGTLTVQ